MALLRPSELARIWELHPKTVYQWIREGKLPAIKTPGAQYRVRTDDARAYCEKNDLPMPRHVATPKGSVAVIGKPGAPLRALARACKARGTALVTWPSGLEGLIGLGAEVHDVIVIDARLDDVKVADALRAIRSAERTREVPIVVYDAANRSAKGVLVRAGASTVAAKGEDDECARAVLELLEQSAVTSAPQAPKRGRALRDRG